MGSSGAIAPVLLIALSPSSLSSPSSSSSSSSSSLRRRLSANSFACSHVSYAVAYDSPRPVSHGVFGPVWYSDSDVLGREVRAVASDALVSDVLGRRRLAGDIAWAFPFSRSMLALAVAAVAVAAGGAVVAGEEWNRRPRRCLGIAIGSDDTDGTDVSMRRPPPASSPPAARSSNSSPLPLPAVAVVAAEKLDLRLE